MGVKNLTTQRRQAMIEQISQSLSFISGGFCIGVGVAFFLILAIASKHNSSGEDEGEGCLGGFIAVIALAMATIFFYIAMTA
jgi:hypothetical protein